jgi:hypothetical protein
VDIVQQKRLKLLNKVTFPDFLDMRQFMPQGNEKKESQKERNINGNLNFKFSSI